MLEGEILYSGKTDEVIKQFDLKKVHFLENLPFHIHIKHFYVTVVMVFLYTILFSYMKNVSLFFIYFIKAPESF